MDGDNGECCGESVGGGDGDVLRADVESDAAEGGEVFVTYELEKSDGGRGRNTEYFVVEDRKIKRCDVYFGPSL